MATVSPSYVDSFKHSFDQGLKVASQEASKLYDQASVQAKVAGEYLGRKISEGYSFVSAKVVEFAQAMFEFLKAKYEEYKPLIDQAKQSVADAFNEMKNNLVRVFDGTAITKLKNSNNDERADISLKTALTFIVADVLLGPVAGTLAAAVVLGNSTK